MKQKVGDISDAPIGLRLVHISAGSFFPLAALWTDQILILVFATTATTIILILEGVRLSYLPINQKVIRLPRLLLKPGEERRFLGATYLLLATTLSFLLFEIWAAIPALLFLSLSEPISALVGRQLRFGRLGRKSVPGAIILFMVTIVIAIVLNTWSQAPPFEVLLYGGVIAALIKLLPLPLNDNFTIPLASGTVIMLFT
jgi:dolichol kinase